MAVAGIKLRMYVFDRKGELWDEIHLPGKENVNRPSVMSVAWDARSQKLAALVAGPKAGMGDAVIVYHVRNRESIKIEHAHDKQDVTHLCWDPPGHVLAAGTVKGNLLLFDARAGKTRSVLKVHDKKITCGAWSDDGRLAMGGEDMSVTISTADGGETSTRLMLKGYPLEMQFAPEPRREGLGVASRANLLSVNLAGKTLYLCRLGDDKDADAPVASTPIEYAFMKRYGAIVSHRWFGEGLVIVGFDSGVIVVLAAHDGAPGSERELDVFKAFPDGGLAHLAHCPEISRVAVAAGAVVKLLDVTNGVFAERPGDKLEFEGDFAAVSCVGWNMRGQMLTVATNQGHVHTFLASLPTIACACEQRLVYLTSLVEVTIADLNSSTVATIAIDAEPSFVALGRAHVAAGMNNRAWFYRVGPPEEQMSYAAERVNQREYVGTIDECALNDAVAAVRCEGRVTCHLIEHEDDPTESMDFTLPAPGGGGARTPTAEVASIALTSEFLVYGTTSGGVCYFHLPERVHVCEYKHGQGAVTTLKVNALGTRVVFVDERATPIFLNPVIDQTCHIPDFQGPAQAILWDATDPECFVISNGAEYQVYAYAPSTINGPVVELVGTHPQTAGSTPVLMTGGVVACQTAGGGMKNELLRTHAALLDGASTSGGGKGTAGDRGRERFVRALNLNRLEVAWDIAVRLQTPEMWEQLAHRAMTHMNIDIATRVYRFVGDASMVMSLERLAHVEDKNVLAGNVLMLFERDDCYDAAQELFLRANKPNLALEMRKDLKHWEEALALAQQADPSQLGGICREYAVVLETEGEHERALEIFERALTYPGQTESETLRARGGVARCTIRVGDVRRGKQMVSEIGDKALCRECAALLEHMNQPSDAAALYEQGGDDERAATIYVGAKNFAAAKPIMSRLSAPKLHSQYARAMEADGKLREAADAYELARDFDAVVRLNLEHLGNPSKAFALARMSRSAEASRSVATFCAKNDDHIGAVEFLLLARKTEEAYAVASEHDLVDRFLELLGSEGTPEEYKSLARRFDAKREHVRAGDAFKRAGDYRAAVTSYLRADDGAGIESAIGVVGVARDDALTNTVVDFLTGAGPDGVVKDANHLFKLHIALRNYEQAARTSILIAKQEQEMGNYKIAHAQLYDTHKEFNAEGKRVPDELTTSLVLLHSYVLVKVLVKLGDHVGAARMLHRVAKKIDKFPAHVVPILTSTVIECQRAGLKRTALEHATTLMKPELRAWIADAYKRKIETIVRKPDKSEEAESTSACVHCDARGPETELRCGACGKDNPFCIASGKRVTREDWARCPGCAFDCRASEMVRVLAKEGACPMCGVRASLSSIKVLDDPMRAAREKADARANEE